jgi:hypothetical protein
MTATHELIRVLRLQASDDKASGNFKDAALMKEAARRLRELDKPDCVWVNADSDEEFETQCGNAFTFIDGGIKENDCKFCQYCGGAVKEAT